MHLEFFCFPSAACVASRGGELWLGLETGCGQRRWVEATCHEASAELICIGSVCVYVCVCAWFVQVYGLLLCIK